MTTGAVIGFLVFFVLWFFGAGLKPLQMAVNAVMLTAAGASVGYLWSLW